MRLFFFFQAEDGIRDGRVTGVQTCALPITRRAPSLRQLAIAAGGTFPSLCHGQLRGRSRESLLLPDPHLPGPRRLYVRLGRGEPRSGQISRRGIGVQRVAPEEVICGRAVVPEERRLLRSNGLKRNVFVRNGPGASRRVLRFRRALIEIVAARAPRRSPSRAAAEVSAPGAFAASAEQHQVVHDDLGHVFLLAAGLVVPGMGAQAALDVNLVALLQILAGNLRGARPGGDVVPLGAVLPVAVFVLEAFVGGQTKLGHGRALGRVFHFGIFAQVAEKNDLVDTFSCHGSSFAGVHYSRITGVELVWDITSVGESIILGCARSRSQPKSQAKGLLRYNPCYACRTRCYQGRWDGSRRAEVRTQVQRDRHPTKEETKRTGGHHRMLHRMRWLARLR